MKSLITFDERSAEKIAQAVRRLQRQLTNVTHLVERAGHVGPAVPGSILFEGEVVDDFDTSDQEFTAAINWTDTPQRRHAVGDEVTVKNFPKESAYLFEGAAGAACFFRMTPAGDFRVIWVECPEDEAASAVAAAGSDQAGAAALVAEVSTVSGADGTKGVKLSTPAAGDVQSVYNEHATNALKVYPHVGGDINDAATNASINLAGKTFANFRSLDGTTWVQY